MQEQQGGITEAELARRLGMMPPNLYRAKQACREITLARLLDLGGFELYIGPKKDPPKSGTP